MYSASCFSTCTFLVPIKHKPGAMKTLFMCLLQNLCAFWEPNPDPPLSNHIFYSLL